MMSRGPKAPEGEMAMVLENGFDGRGAGKQCDVGREEGKRGCHLQSTRCAK